MEEIKPNILKAEITGLIKVLAYSGALLFFILIFVYIMTTIIDLNMINESLKLLGVSLPNFSGMLTSAILIFFVIIFGNAIFIYLNISKSIKFDNKLTYYDHAWIDLPYKNIVSINYSKNFFSGDKLTLTLTGTSKEKIEIPFVDNAEETCKRLNEMIKNEIPPIPK